MNSNRIPHRLRRLSATLAVGLTLSLLPLPSFASTAQADSPSAVVTGLSRGARGDAVRDVQQALVSQGVGVPGGVDGVFGPATEGAVKTFQTRNGLIATGKIDSATAIALGLESSALLGLTRGTRGDKVENLQQKLIAAGHSPTGGADGIFGASTEAALKSYQRSLGYLPTGTVNAATAAALKGVRAAASDADEPTASPPAEETGAEPAEEPAAEEPAAEEPAAEEPAAQQPQPADDAASSLSGLRIGSRGESVKRVQRIIMSQGFTVVGGADGIYGVLTASAVKSFQNANGLEVTGAVDAGTAAVLERVAGTDEQADEPPEHDPTVTSPFIGLRYGSLGDDVKALQQAMLDAGISVRGGADGVFGPATQAAVRTLQSRHGLEQTGRVDDATANALASRNPSGAPSPLVGLAHGALGNTVKDLQQSLIDVGVTVRGGADGIFGPATAQALKTFQTSQDLEVTGVVDAATVAALANPKKAKEPSGGGEPAELGYAEFGEKGTRVLALQAALVEAGVPLRGGVDGNFGGGTSAAVMEFQRQRGFSVTGKVNGATAEALGLTAAETPTAPDPTTVTLSVFPVQGKCYYGDSYGYPRGGGRVHLGVDIIAAEGKLLYAVAEGKIDKVYTDYPGSLAGNGVRLRMADGTYFFYAHMLELADGIELGVPVRAGQVLGKVGSTGSSGTPHLHFEVHPQGGSAVNPYPLVKAIDACSVTTPLGQG